MNIPLPRWLIWWTLFALITLCTYFVARSEFPTQGSGAIALVKGAKVSQSISALEVPKAIALPPRLLFFVATAIHDGLESDFSNEIVTTNPWPNLTWDSMTNVTGFKVYRGRQSGTYTNSWDTTTNLFSVPRPIRLTNEVITVTSQQATNLQYRVSPTGPWVLAGYTSNQWDNPTWTFREWRGMGSRSYRPASVFINRRIE